MQESGGPEPLEKNGEAGGEVWGLNIHICN